MTESVHFLTCTHENDRTSGQRRIELNFRTMGVLLVYIEFGIQVVIQVFSIAISSGTYAIPERDPFTHVHQVDVTRAFSLPNCSWRLSISVQISYIYSVSSSEVRRVVRCSTCNCPGQRAIVGLAWLTWYIHLRVGWLQLPVDTGIQHVLAL